MSNSISEKKRSLLLIGSIAAVASIAITISMGLVGQTTVQEKNIDSEKNITLNCERTNAPYPFFTYDNTISQSTDIRIVFKNDSFFEISLIHRMKYSNYSQVSSSSAINTADLNLSFGKDDLEAFSLNSKFDTQSDTMQFSMFESADKMSINKYKYFLIDDGEPTINHLENKLTNQSFKCSKM